jgi:uncharacterized protein YccT (UPF0319 family)
MPVRSCTSTQQVLMRLADSLGCSTSVFFDQPGHFQSRVDTMELLQLWNRIADEECRQKVLAYARWIADEQSHPQQSVSYGY